MSDINNSVTVATIEEIAGVVPPTLIESLLQSCQPGKIGRPRSVARVDQRPVQVIDPAPRDEPPLHNFGDECCGGDLALDLANSCDTAYAKIGLKLGGTRLFDEATAFGFNKIPPLDLPSGEVVPAVFPSPSAFAQNLPGVAYSAIGQEDVAETALEDALVAAAIGDDGTIMTPHLLSSVVNNQGSVVMRYTPHPWLQAPPRRRRTRCAH